MASSGGGKLLFKVSVFVRNVFWGTELIQLKEIAFNAKS
jgi:hypothetical protein